MSEKQGFFQKNKKLIFEFLRYVIVGGVSAVVDMAVNAGMLYLVFRKTEDDKGFVAISVAVGFLVGLTVNYILSNIFVFNSDGQKEKGKTAGAFFTYALVGLIGLGLTECFTILGTYLIGEGSFWYLVLSAVVKCIVLVWNYVGRKIFVYKGK